MTKPEPISQQVIEAWIKSKKKKIKVYPCHVNRASSLGHPCERYLVYQRLAWDKKALYEWQVQAIFDEGNRQERAVEDDLRESGFDVIEQQRPFRYEKLNITGHIDGKLHIADNIVVPYETKSMAPHIWYSINSLQDMFQSKYVWVRNYPAQMYLYLLMDNSEYGIFILKNKSSGHWKVIDVYLDYGYSEGLLKKAERINNYVKTETYPDQIDDVDICTRCDFRHLCLPDMGGMEFTKGIIIEHLDEFMTLQELINNSGVLDLQKRYRELREILKKIFTNRTHVMAGPYLITGKWSGGPKQKYWNMDIQYLKKE